MRPLVTPRRLAAVLAVATSLTALPALHAAAAPTSGAAPSAVAAPETTPVLMPTLVSHLVQVAPATPVRVMIQAGGDVSAAKAAATRAGLAPEVSLDRVGIAVAVGTADQIRRLGADSAVTRVDWADEPLAQLSNTSHRATRALPVHEGAVDVDGGGALDGFDGRGFSVAVVDSGTDGTHPMFRDEDGDSRVRRNMKVVCSDAVPILAAPAGQDRFKTAESCTVDATALNDTDSPSIGGHGTHVTGIAAGGIVTDSAGRQLRGAAPEADIVAVSTGATLSVYGGTTGLYWLLLHHDDPCGDGACPPVVAVNNSWGPSGGGAFSPTAPQVIVQRLLVEEGVSVVWAAGNDGGDGTASVTNPYSLDPTPGVLSVANYDDAGTGSRDNALDSSSSRGLAGSVPTYPDLSAPGANITSACRPWLPVCATGLDFEDPDYNTISGTSMAAPHVAGYIAVLQQVARETLGRLLTPAEVEDLLLDTAHRFGSRPWEVDVRNPDSTTPTSFDAGHGLVDLLAAVERLTGLAGVVPDEEPCPVDAAFTDPAGDATGVLGVGTPLPNAKGLDVLRGWLTSDAATDDVTVHWEVEDLATSPGGLEGTGEHFDVNFSFGGGGYFLSASRTVDTGVRFRLGRYTDTGRTTLSSALTGSFDAATDQVSITLPAALWSQLALPGTFTKGAEISGVEIVGRRSLVLVVPDADTAAGGCAYSIGAEHGPGGGDPVNAAPVALATATPATVLVGEEVRFDGSGSTDEEDPQALTYSWDFGDGGSAQDATGPAATRTFAAAGTYAVTLRVTDPQGLTDSETVNVVVNEPEPEPVNERPYAEAGVDRSEVHQRGVVAFSSDGSTDPEDGTPASYSWSFGDGGSAADSDEPNPEFAYAKPGRYVAVLTVTDSQGAKDTDKVVVQVSQTFACEAARVVRSKGWDVAKNEEAEGGRYCRGKDGDTVKLTFDGPRLDLGWGRAARGGVGYVVVDGRSIGKVSFRFDSSSPAFGYTRTFKGLGEGRHTVEVRVRDGLGYLDHLTVWR